MHLHRFARRIASHIAIHEVRAAHFSEVDPKSKRRLGEQDFLAVNPAALGGSPHRMLTGVEK
jgi:hypothetical protein